MPIYAYRCETCGHAKDVLQKLSDPLLTVCPACGADTFRKQLTAAGFQLKGSGWYVTDFKGGSAAAAPAKPDDAAAAAQAGESDTGKGDKGKSDKGTAPTVPAAADAATPKAPAPAAPAPAAAPKSSVQGGE
jgi:putative FmdB family regulatory protein